MNCLRYLSLCLLLLATSCAPSIIRGLHKEGSRMVGKEELIPPLQANGQLQRYHMTFDLGKHHFSGMFLIKKTGEERHRTLFTTHFGLTVFDFEISGEELTVHHCMEPLNKQQLLNLLYHDFALLLGLHFEEVNPAILYRSATDSTQVYRLTQKPSKGYYRAPSPSSPFEKIQTGRGITKRTLCATPGTVVICHRFPALRISLEEIRL